MKIFKLCTKIALTSYSKKSLKSCLFIVLLLAHSLHAQSKQEQSSLIKNSLLVGCGVCIGIVGYHWAQAAQPAPKEYSHKHKKILVSEESDELILQALPVKGALQSKTLPDVSVPDVSVPAKEEMSDKASDEESETEETEYQQAAYAVAQSFGASCQRTLTVLEAKQTPHKQEEPFIRQLSTRISLRNEDNQTDLGKLINKVVRNLFDHDILGPNADKEPALPRNALHNDALLNYLIYEEEHVQRDPYLRQKLLQLVTLREAVYETQAQLFEELITHASNHYRGVSIKEHLVKADLASAPRSSAV